MLDLRVGKFELDLPLSGKRSPTLNTPFVMYRYTPGTPYTATIGGTSTSFYLNPDSFLLGATNREANYRVSPRLQPRMAISGILSPRSPRTPLQGRWAAVLQIRPVEREDAMGTFMAT